jgi:hypothetical protein
MLGSTALGTRQVTCVSRRYCIDCSLVGSDADAERFGTALFGAWGLMFAQPLIKHWTGNDSTTQQQKILG